MRAGRGLLLILVAVFVLIGVLRLPTVTTVLCLAPFSIALGYVAHAAPRRRAAAGPDR